MGQFIGYFVGPTKYPMLVQNVSSYDNHHGQGQGGKGQGGHHHRIISAPQTSPLASSYPPPHLSPHPSPEESPHPLPQRCALSRLRLILPPLRGLGMQPKVATCGFKRAPPPL